ncbi:hypothetical protein D9M72_550150 [compost metagenome]
MTSPPAAASAGSGDTICLPAILASMAARTLAFSSSLYRAGSYWSSDACSISWTASFSSASETASSSICSSAILRTSSANNNCWNTSPPSTGRICTICDLPLAAHLAMAQRPVLAMASRSRL